MDDERAFIERRLSELAEQSVSECRYRYTDFLSLYELSVFHEMEKDLSYAAPLPYGGCEASERCMIRFGAEEQLGYSEDFPISILEVAPVMEKYAGKLSHRDFLGSVLGLGLERSKIGDIFIKDSTACIFVNESVAEFIITNLSYVKRTKVMVKKLSKVPENLTPHLEKYAVLVNSNRIDAIIAKLYGLSRDDSLSLVRNRCVFIDGRQISKNANALQNGQVVSVRGYGRFIFDGEGSRTRKDRVHMNLRIYR